MARGPCERARCAPRTSRLNSRASAASHSTTARARRFLVNVWPLRRQTSRGVHLWRSGRAVNIEPCSPPTLPANRPVTEPAGRRCAGRVVAAPAPPIDGGHILATKASQRTPDRTGRKKTGLFWGAVYEGRETPPSLCNRWHSHLSRRRHRVLRPSQGRMRISTSPFGCSSGWAGCERGGKSRRASQNDLGYGKQGSAQRSRGSGRGCDDGRGVCAASTR